MGQGRIQERIRPTGVFFLIGASLLAQADETARRCPPILAAFGQGVKTVAYHGLITVPKQIGMTLYFPVVALSRVGAHGVDRARGKQEEEPRTLGSRFSRADHLRIALFALFFALSYTTVNYRDFEKATAGFDAAQVSGTTAILDFFKDDDSLYPAAGTYVFNHKYAGTDAVLLRGADLDALAKAAGDDAQIEINSLVDYAIEHGPFGKIDEFGHGLPGFPERIYWDAGVIGYKKKHKDGRPFKAADLFVPGAQLRLNTCFIANGDRGELFIADFGDSFFEKGGVLYLSALQMTANPLEYLAVRYHWPKPPDVLRDLAQPLATPLGVWTGGELALNRLLAGEGDRKFAFPVKASVVIVNIPPKEKRWRGPTALREAIAGAKKALETESWWDDILRRRVVSALRIIGPSGEKLPVTANDVGMGAIFDGSKVRFLIYRQGTANRFHFEPQANMTMEVPAPGTTSAPTEMIIEVPSPYFDRSVIAAAQERTQEKARSTAWVENYSLAHGGAEEKELLAEAERDLAADVAAGHLTKDEAAVALDYVPYQLALLRRELRHLREDRARYIKSKKEYFDDLRQGIASSK